MVARCLAALIRSGAVAIRLAACWAPVSAHAQAVSKSFDGALTLRSLVDRAWERAARARTAEGRQQEAAARRLKVQSPFAGAPAVTLSTREDRFAGSSIGAREHIATLSAPIWLPGQQGARGALAEADVAQAEAATVALRLAVAGEVRERVWTLAAPDAESQLATARAESSAALRDDVARRVQGGDLARADALLAQQDTFATQALAREAELRRNKATFRLEPLAGTRLRGSPDEPVSPPIQIDAHPGLAAARLARESAERRVRLVNLLRRDPSEVGVGYRWDQPSAAVPAGRTVGVSIRIPFATAARNLRRQAATRTELDTAFAKERLTGKRVEGAGWRFFRGSRQSA